MKIHEVKCHPEPFQASLLGDKPYEVRVDDRDYQVGDVVVRREWNPQGGYYTGLYLVNRISYLTAGGEWGLPENLCVFGLGPA